MGRKLNVEAEHHFAILLSRSRMHLGKVHDAFNVESNTVSQPFKSHVQVPRKPKHNMFYLEFQPLIIVLMIFGRITINRDSNGKYKWKWLTWLNLICFVSYSIQTYLAILVCFERVQAVFKSSEYDEFIFAIHVLAYVQIHFHVPFYWLKEAKYAHYLNQWSIFEADWMFLTGVPLKPKYKKFALAYVLIVLPSIALVMIMEKYSTLHDPFQYLLPYFFAIGSTACILGIWYITCLEIAAIAKDLSHHLKEKLNTNPDPSFLKKWRKLWLQLCCLVSNLGTSLLTIMASIFFTYSTTFLLGFYNAFSQIINGDFTLKTVGYLTASSVSLLVIYIVCDSGHQATTNVVSFTSKCILKSDVPLAREDIKFEFDLILRALQADPPQLQLAGFVTLNRPLFISFVANALTYLIVILQFKR